MAALVCVVGFFADFELTRNQAEDLGRELATHDIAGGLSERLRVGMPRATAESLIAGWRSTSEFAAGGELTIVYSYWLGVVPPLPRPLRYKAHAKVSVSYDASGTVTSVRSWYS
jgi:hypothetical protein